MRRPFLLTLAALPLLGAASGGGAAAAAALPPVVVELYTAQGCAACLPADRLVTSLAERKGVVALTVPVDYWDYVGWADTFAQPAFTDRQKAYARRLKVREIYTPEVIVNGQREAGGPGLDEDAVDALIHSGARDLAQGPHVRLLDDGARVEVAPGHAKAARSDVWLVRYDPQARTVRVKAGDNKGKTVVQRDVVRELVHLGAYAGGVRTYALPPAQTQGLTTLVLVQGVRGGRIYAAGAA